MEFKEYGPLAESKEMASNKKTIWVPLVLMLSLGLIMGVAWSNIVIDNQPWNKGNKE